MVAVHLYVEGGGDAKRLRTACRKGFTEFFKKAELAGSLPRIIASGSRRSAYDDFCTALGQTNVCALLLVDSEEAVADSDGPWEHLKKRPGDQWDRPKGASDGQCHLMVQIMESWFLADKATVADYFGNGFKKKALPNRDDVEAVPKADVLKSLRDATRRTAKGGYSKGKHSFEILALIRPNLVRQASHHAHRLLVALTNPEEVCGVA
jgi:Domain of unknown function (DUF4276)